MTSSSRSNFITVLVVDDHPVLRDGLAAMLQVQTDMKLIGEASNGLEAIESFRTLRPDVTLMDLQMPIMDGVEAIKRIRAEFPVARIIVLTTYAGDAQAVRALKAGAVGYMLKGSARTELIEVVRSVHAGKRRIPPEIANEIAVHVGDEALSDREISVMRLVAAGNANKKIAWQLSVTEDTVKAHMKNIFAKLDVSDRAHAVAIAAKRGIIDL